MHLPLCKVVPGPSNWAHKLLRHANVLAKFPSSSKMRRSEGIAYISSALVYKFSHIDTVFAIINMNDLLLDKKYMMLRNTHNPNISLALHQRLNMTQFLLVIHKVYHYKTVLSLILSEVDMG